MDFLQWCVLEDESSYLLYVGNWFIPVMILVVYFFLVLQCFLLKYGTEASHSKCNCTVDLYLCRLFSFLCFSPYDS